MAKALTNSEMVELIIKGSRSSEPLAIGENFTHENKFFHRVEEAYLSSVYVKETDRGSSTVILYGIKVLSNGRSVSWALNYNQLTASDKKKLQALVEEKLRKL